MRETFPASADLNSEEMVMKLRIMMSVLAATALAPVTLQAAEQKSVTETVKENVSDSAITARIKTEFAKDKDVSAMKINVDTDDKGRVTLRGTARSQAEADKAARIARDTRGVVSVKSDIRVQPD